MYAVLSAAGRARTNHGAMMAFTVTPLIAAQPAPLTIAAAKSCQGLSATAQPNTPALSATAASRTMAGMPKRPNSAGRFAATIAPLRKWIVTASEATASENPRASRTTCR